MTTEETHFDNANEVEFAEPDSGSDPDDEGFEEYHQDGDQQRLSTGTSKSNEATSVESSDKASKTKHRSRKKRALSPLLDLLDVAPAVSKNFSPNGGTPYLSYDEETWNPQFLYRLPADIALNAIRERGTEGVGRIEIGKKMGMDTTTKAGNRRVSSYILTVCNEHPDHFGQYQKMEGKFRCIKYYWKADSQPEQFTRLFEEFERLAGTPCPFKLGQVVKFPNCNLSTLRISDVTLHRLIDLLDLVDRHRVLVTFHRMIKAISERELSRGYDFTIDKKSLVKCLKALESVHLITMFDTLVVAESVENKVRIVCHRDIHSADDPEVIQVIQATVDEYHKEGRVFPHGQLRFSVKKRAEVEARKSSTDSLAAVNSDCSNGIDLKLRYSLLRLQTSLSAVLRKAETNEVRVVSDKAGEKEGDGEQTSGSRLKNKKDESHLDAADVSLIGEGSELVSSIDYGYQSKALRLFILHELAFAFVHGHPEGTKPTIYDLFPPGESFATYPERSVDELTVYVDEESPLRFLPPMPPFTDIPRGWFMLHDFFVAMSLSVFVSIAYVNRSVDRKLLLSYLCDPIKRHIPIGCLPLDLRMAILKDKKVARQIEHILLTLAAMGLMAVAANPDPKCFPFARATVFYVSKRAALYDTSTSGRGYATVTLPLSNYDRYSYEFNTTDDVVLFWHHLRAIVQSTPLSFRNDVNSEEVSQARHKKYSLGQFEKGLVTVDPNNEIDELIPLGPHEGCAGFDSALYLHLKRHWDIDPRQNSYVGWFIARFRRQSDKMRHVVESRVANLKKDWNSYVKSLMPSELELTKTKKNMHKAASNEGMVPAATRTVTIDPVKKRPPQKKAAPTKKKRPMDSVDIVSAQNRLHLRSRFSSRERDLLIMIRAVGFFLNPVYRFWLDPAVVRDIMHEYIPESRSKTVQSLMAAGVREMVRPARLAYLQRIVRNLSTFQEMRDLRFQLASAPLSTAESKTSFFKNAFDIANRLLYIEHQALPVTATSNKQFEAYLRNSHMIVSAEQSLMSPVPLRSQTPKSLTHIHHCVAVNILLSILIHSTDGAFSESILDQISAAVISKALQILRSDGLVSRSRALDPHLMVITRNQAMISYYFRHFFTHRFHPDTIEQTLSVCNSFDDNIEGSEEVQGDLPGALIAAASSFCNNGYLEISVDEDVFQMFEQAALDQGTGPQSIKQIRYLENTDLHLEQIHVYGGMTSELPILPTWQSLLALIDWSQPADKHPPLPFEEYLLDIPVSERKILRAVYKPISSSGAFGATMGDLKKATDLTAESLRKTLNDLMGACQIMCVGVDEHRWIAPEYSTAWCLNVSGRLVTPRPWTMPSGEICPATVRWMAESVLMTVVTSPGITLKEICFRLEFALQAAAIHDLVIVLKEAHCLLEVEEVFENMTLSSPFQKENPEEIVTYLLPTAGCFETFARIFGGISLLPAMTGRTDGEKEEEFGRDADRSSGGEKEVNVTLPVVERAL